MQFLAPQQVENKKVPSQGAFLFLLNCVELGIALERCQENSSFPVKESSPEFIEGR